MWNGPICGRSWSVSEWVKHFFDWIKVLYAAPSSRIRVNGEMSGPFELHRGTRQGCPLSPLLFELALEPLAARIRASPGIVGFRRGQRSDVVSLYAEDTLLYLSDTMGSLQAVMTLIDDFRKLSGFAKNWDKSVLMSLDPLPCPLPECVKAVEVVHNFKYLGIQIFPEPTEYIRLNLLPILIKFREKCSLV